VSLLLLFNAAAGAGPVDVVLLYKPIVDEIATLLRARTVGYGSGETGTFLDASDQGGPTNPTKTEVTKLINDAAAVIASSVGVGIPQSTWPLARRAVSLQAAMRIEGGSEQVSEARYDRFERELNGYPGSRGLLAALIDAVQDAQAGGDPGEVDDRPTPLGLFPLPTPLDW
jgi:hypothetical protein